MAGEGTEQRAVAAQSDKTMAVASREVPRDTFGNPMVEISSSATELVPTIQYGNVTIGPVVVRRWVPDGDDDHLAEQIRRVSQLCETAVSEDRQTVHAMLRQSTDGRIQT